jgi:hypothetical protein
MFTLDEASKPKVLASSILKPDVSSKIISSFSDLHLNEFRRKSRDPKITLEVKSPILSNSNTVQTVRSAVISSCKVGLRQALFPP